MKISKAIEKKLKANLEPNLASWFDTATHTELWRMNLKELADKISTSHEKLLPVFLEGVSSGAFVLNWEYHCPHCNGIPDFKHRFNEVSSESYCGMCKVGFRNTLDENIEVTFTLHDSVQTLSTKVLQEMKDTMIKAIKEKTLTMPEKFLSGLDVLNNPLFQEIFGKDVLSAEESLSIKSMTFLFTDIKGSTQMYTTHGDVASYRLVREHFKILFREVESHGGVVVKTIGDAIMASFTRPGDAVNAALSAYKSFQDRDWELVGKLEIKMGLHTGNAIAVNLNDRTDYFGNTVNMAARIQGIAENHSVCLSNTVAQDQEVRKILKGYQKGLDERITKNIVQLKGIGGKVEMYQLRKNS